MSFNIQNWFVCSSIRNCIAYANEANKLFSSLSVFLFRMMMKKPAKALEMILIIWWKNWKKCTLSSWKNQTTMTKSTTRLSNQNRLVKCCCVGHAIGLIGHAKTSCHRVHPCLQENVWLTLLIRFRVWCVTSSHLFAFGLKYTVSYENKVMS